MMRLIRRLIVWLHSLRVRASRFADRHRIQIRAVRCYAAALGLLLSVPALALLVGPWTIAQGCWLAVIAWSVYLVCAASVALALIERGREWWALGRAVRRTEAERRERWKYYLGEGGDA